MNGHVGADVDGFEGVHGGYGFGKRNVDGVDVAGICGRTLCYCEYLVEARR